MYKRDRRIFERFAVDFPAEVKHLEAQKSSSAQSCNVSASGIGLFTEEKLIPEANLEIWLGIPNGHPPFRGLARVVWSEQVQENRWRSGMRFRAVNFMGLRRILKKP